MCEDVDECLVHNPKIFSCLSQRRRTGSTHLSELRADGCSSSWWMCQKQEVHHGGSTNAAEFCAALLSNTIYTITLAFGVKMSKNVSTEQILLVFIELKGTVYLKMNIQSSSPPPGRLNLFGFRMDKQ